MGPTCHRLHLTYITSPLTLLHSSFLFHRRNPQTTHLLCLAMKKRWQPQNLSGGGASTWVAAPPSLGARPTNSSSIKSLPPFTSTHHTKEVSVDKHLALGHQMSRESLGEKESIQRIKKRVGTKEIDQDLKG